MTRSHIGRLMMPVNRCSEDRVAIAFAFAFALARIEFKESHAKRKRSTSRFEHLPTKTEPTINVIDLATLSPARASFSDLSVP